MDVPAKRAARVRLFDTGHNRKTDARDAHSIAIVAVRAKTVRPRDIAGKTRRRIAAEELADLVAVEVKIKKATAELKTWSSPSPHR